MNLGENILNKISDLLVEIERPKSPRRRPKKPKQQVPYADTWQGQRLYNNRKGIDKTYQREKQRIEAEIANMQQFKVQNKHSIFLNSRNDIKPIHQRTQDILRQREVSIEKKRAEYERDRKRRLQERGETGLDDDEDCIPLEHTPRKVASKKQLEEILQRLGDGERERLRKQNEEKMKHLKEKIMNNTGKPQLSKESQRIWERKQVQNSLSPNVFERFDKYLWDYKCKQQKYRQQIVEQETPFKPKLSKNTEQIAKVARARNPGLVDDLSRSTSCRCFGKHQTGANTSRKPEPQTQERSKSPGSLSHNASRKEHMRKSKTNLTIDPNC